jgi:hypothetical protein
MYEMTAELPVRREKRAEAIEIVNHYLAHRLRPLPTAAN